MSTAMFAGQEVESSSSFESPQPCRKLTLSEIQLATQNFDESLVIGRGGFGKVFKGTIASGTSRVTAAIKRLDLTSNQGAHEFWAEIKMLSKLRHCHLVSLIGYCNDGQEMILVYEYMPNGTLVDHLHKHGVTLSWVTRIKICIGAARGLDYLHTGTGIHHGVIHRDVKSSNIMLDGSWAAKISDFGLSKIGPTNQPSTYVNTLVKGTFGYLDPDYFQTGRLTRKSDVYAFGVVLFEVLCGKRAVDRSLDEEQWGFARWAQDSIKEGRLKQIVDSRISRKITPKCLKKFAQLADRCLHSHLKHRPTMAEIVVGLESILAFQEKANTTLQPAGMTIFGRKVPMLVFSSNGDNSVDVKSLKTLELINHAFRRFDFDTLNVATENFSEANKFLDRGYVSMYKGSLQNGQNIAITLVSSPAYKRYKIPEVTILVKLKHKNLVTLLGYCIEGMKLFLVYEFAGHLSLDHLIFDPMSHLLDWNKRYKILLGIARVLVYLHKNSPIRIIHGNLSSDSILLDESFDPKLSCLGIAKEINETDCIFVDNISGWTRVPTAPEYHCNLHVSTKTDVYRFGVLVLETITGLRVLDLSLGDDMNLLRYVQRNWLEGTSSNIIDPRINVDSSSMTKFVEIGLLCVQTEPTDRPTMEEIIDILLDDLSVTLSVSEMRERMIRERSKYINDSVVDDYDTSAAEEFISDLCPR